MDFNGVSEEILFGNKREVYRLNADKLQGICDCNLCKLIYDYTKICKHSKSQSETPIKFD